MSQEKVDRYKSEKANRKKTMKKQKAAHAARSAAVGVVALALIVWLGYSAYDLVVSNQERVVTEIDYTAIDEYAQSLSAAE